MSKHEEFKNIFSKLRAILKQHENKLVVVKNTEDNYYLDTAHIMKNQKPLFFGATNIKKNYVSYHLMPVYVNPELLSGISPELEKRRQGKSCFNFKTSDPVLFKELAKITRAGIADYKSQGYL
ncbi:MAG: hypothetical protein HKN88_10205 [Gammaproteobacteria bacterium]|nr:DUF1801 domain-containing protein [Gammaproteobacteria bacterium]NNC98428.1 hypothetical protein [Gammaproteobacteria bacterium]NNM14735.1 hypothetical protein [Gammaproteobacteria bacterium]